MTFLRDTASVAAAWASGALGNIEQIKIGDIVVSACERLSIPTELSITRKTLGTGYPVTDAAVKLPLDATLEIAFVDPQYTFDEIKTSMLTGDISNISEGWRDRKDALIDYQNNLEIVTLQTHENIYENTLVALIDPFYDANELWDGFFATVVMSQIKRQTTEEGGLFDSIPNSEGVL